MTSQPEYKKLTQLEHILLRSDMYIGSMEKQREQMWILDKKSEKIIQKEIVYIPGFLKIFDEILVNAIDQSISTLNPFPYQTMEKLFQLSLMKRKICMCQNLFLAIY
jgi:DNA gyrase/topoisomerase IV subunit B